MVMVRREGGDDPQDPHVCLEWSRCVYNEESHIWKTDLLAGEGGMDVFIRTQMMPDDADVSDVKN